MAASAGRAASSASTTSCFYRKRVLRSSGADFRRRPSTRCTYRFGISPGAFGGRHILCGNADAARASLSTERCFISASSIAASPLIMVRFQAARTSRCSSLWRAAGYGAGGGYFWRRSCLSAAEWRHAGLVRAADGSRRRRAARVCWAGDTLGGGVGGRPAAGVRMGDSWRRGMPRLPHVLRFSDGGGHKTLWRGKLSAAGTSPSGKAS